MGNFSVDLVKMDNKFDNSQFYNTMHSFFSRLFFNPPE